MAISKASMKEKNEINISRYPGYSWQWMGSYGTCSTFFSGVIP